MAIEQPLISVIVPAYNVQDSIKNIIDQLLNQTYKNLEILIINDGSSDNTDLILNNISDSHIRIFNKANGGVSSARNVGLENAKGKFIAFVDPGDKVDKDFILYLYNLLISTSSQLSICSYDFELEDGTILDRSKYYEVVDKNTFFTKETATSEIIKNYSKLCGHVWDKMFLRELIGDLRFDEHIHNCEDTLFDFEYIQKCNRIVLGPEIHYWYIQNSDSATRGEYSEKYFTSLIAWEKILEKSKKSNDRKYLEEKITCDVLNHELEAWKTLDKKKRKRYKKVFLRLMNKYKTFTNLKQRIKWSILKFLWSI